MSKFIIQLTSYIRKKLLSLLIRLIKRSPFTFFSPRVSTLIDGGLGSQMWQFALGYTVAKKRGIPLTLTLDFYTSNGKDLNGNKNRLFLLFENFPKIKNNYSNSIEHSRLFLDIYRDSSTRSTYDYNPDILSSRGSIFLSQYYCNAQYIKDMKLELLELFRMDLKLSEKELSLLNLIRASNSCFVHIRKGDFVGFSLDVCSDFYYISAINELLARETNVTFFIFSNDEQYFETHILPKCPSINVIIVKGRTEENPSTDFYIMTQCKHSIISNSGFSWMASFLKDSNGYVIMPDRWNNDPSRIEASKSAFYIPGWIQLPTK